MFLKIVWLNLFHCLSLHASRPFLSLMAAQLGANAVEVGLISAPYSLVQAVAALPAGRLIAAQGVRPVGLSGGGSFLAGLLLLMQAQNLWVLAVASALMGLGHVLILLCGQYVVTAGSDSTEKAQAVGWLSFSTSLGSFLGPVLGGAMQHCWGSRMGFTGGLLSAAVGLACACCLPGKTARPSGCPPAASVSIRGGEPWRDIITSGVIFFSADILTTYLPLYGRQAGLDTAAVGIILGVNGLAQMAVRPFMGRLCARYTMYHVFRLCLLTGGGAIAAIGTTGGFVPLLLAAALAGCSIGLANPLTLLTVSGTKDDALRSRVLALRVMANYAGQTVSPLLFGALATLAGMRPVFWVSGGILLLCVTGTKGSKRN